jgi:hypothetical protein
LTIRLEALYYKTFFSCNKYFNKTRVLVMGRNKEARLPREARIGRWANKAGRPV